jgi:hypothetical protein
MEKRFSLASVQVASMGSLAIPSQRSPSKNLRGRRRSSALGGCGVQVVRMGNEEIATRAQADRRASVTVAPSIWELQSQMASMSINLDTDELEPSLRPGNNRFTVVDEKSMVLAQPNASLTRSILEVVANRRIVDGDRDEVSKGPGLGIDSEESNPAEEGSVPVGSSNCHAGSVFSGLWR